MSDYRHGYVTYRGHEYKVTWHPISKEVYVYWGTDKYCGKAYDMQEALDTACPVPRPGFLTASPSQFSSLWQ